MHSKWAVMVLVPIFTQACGSDASSAGPAGGAGSANAGSAGGSSAGSAGQAASNGGASAGSGGDATLVAGATAGGASGASQAGAAGNAGMGGVVGTLEIAKALDGLRVDDPCAGTPMTSDGAVCPHVTLTASGGSQIRQSVTIAGAEGTIFDVTLRVRGVVEPSNIVGGVRADTSTFEYKNLSWRKTPFTVGGTVTQADYSQWHLAVANPAADYYLNDYQRAGHYIFELDYQVTVPIAANSKVTLDGTDSNERMIVNFEKYAPDGIPGSMNFGQFVQINVVAVEPR